MNKGLATVIGLAIGATGAGSASAQASNVRPATEIILHGDFAAAEAQLAAERRIYPQDPAVLLNLAAVYASTSRMPAAAQLYRRVLAREDVLMDLSDDRTASSHAIALRGLARAATVETAAR